MPTEEWFKENPKISAYISKQLNQRLSTWMKAQNIRKTSQALTAILEEYFKVNQSKLVNQTILEQPTRLELLEGK